MNLKESKFDSGSKINKPEITYISTYHPVKCGIATFTSDLMSATRELFGKYLELNVVAISSEKKKDCYSEEVIYELSREGKEGYEKCADFLNKRKKMALVCVQHEFGLFGGEFGSHLLVFLKKIKKPVVVTFHSVIPKPDKNLYKMVRQIAFYSKKIVVMSNNSKKILEKEYHISESKVTFIPHGIHLFPYQDNYKSKKKLGYKDRTLLLTFGFLSPNKGIEFVVEALPEAVKKYPKLLYLVVGQTHPVIKKNERESYRQMLLERVEKLKLNKNVKFVNSFQDLEDLLLYLKAADIYISTSIDSNQAVSGTFSYALGSGRANISTEFKQSKEYLKKDMGILVKPKNPDDYREALLNLLKSKKKRVEMGRNCYFRTRNMVWQNVALQYGKLFNKQIKKSEINISLPLISLKHLFKLTDKFGILQFAKLSIPDKNSGYTVDDNARALIVACLYYRKTEDKTALKYIKIYLKFLHYTLDDSGYFRNYVDFNRSFNEKENQKASLEDPTARALYALARIASMRKLPKDIRLSAKLIFEKSFQTGIKFKHVRSTSFYLKALYFYSLLKKDGKIQDEIKQYADILVEKYKKHSTRDWFWFENILTYSNGLVPQALALVYLATGDKLYLKIAKEAADFLIKNTFHDGMCIPIGQNGWLQKGKEKQYFDQQPEEATSLVEMLKTLYEITKRKKYKKLMRKSFGWFLGENTLEQLVCDFGSGGCYDGVGEKEINLNQGAESTISYLIARLTVS